MGTAKNLCLDKAQLRPEKGDKHQRRLLREWNRLERMWVRLNRRMERYQGSPDYRDAMVCIEKAMDHINAFLPD